MIAYPDCPFCDGTGIDRAFYVPATHLTPSEAEPCPVCGVRAERELWRNAQIATENELKAARAQIAAALALHWREERDYDPPRPICHHCVAAWPCPTVRALTGETP